MKHIDQHSLEMYALDSEELELSARQIERHLAVCASCRDLLLEIQEFYGRAAEAMTNPVQPPPPATEALDRAAQRLPVFAEPHGNMALRWKPSLLGRLYVGVRTHPAMAGAGALMLGALAWTLVSVAPRLMSDRNPAYASLNSGSNRLEVYNESNELLWTIPATGTDGVKYAETTDNLASLVVTDLDGDGRNEVVTTLKSVGRFSTPEGALLAAIGQDGTILWHQLYTQTVAFRGDTLPNVWLQYGMIVQDFDGDGKKEIVCCARSARSPSAILRYGADGNLLGEYWHYGHLAQLKAVDFAHTGKPKLLLGGVNDSDGAGDFGFAILTLLDPVRIIGKTEAVTTRGFGYDTSSAEISCIRLPNTPQNTQYHSKPGIDAIVIDSSAHPPTFSAWWAATVPGYKMVLEYVFGSDMVLRTLRSSDTTIRFLVDLRQKGEMTPQEIESFLPSLRSGVEYWDGKTWGKSPLLLAVQSR